MRALVIAVAVLMSAVASAQDYKRPPPPGQPTGPITQPAPPVPGYNTPAPAPEAGPQPLYWDEAPETFRNYRGVLVVVEREQLLARIARLEELIGRAAENSGRGSRNALRKADEELDALRYDLTSARELRHRGHRPQQPAPPPPPPVPAVQPITEAQLDQLMKAIGRESFSDGKLRVLSSAAPTQYFLVPQVQKLLQRFSFGEDKLNAMRVLWPRVLDRENAFQLYGSFTFQGEKEQLRQIIGQ
jgi:hypothetical protein